VRLPWEEAEVLKSKFIKVDTEVAAVHKASITEIRIRIRIRSAEMELVQGMYVADEGGRAGKVGYVNMGVYVSIDWLDTGEYEQVSRERLALAVAGPDDQAALAAAGWRVEWALPPPVSTMHPSTAGSASQEKGQDMITLRRSLHDSEPEADFGEESLHKRWLEERADADPTDFAELDSSADSRAEALERRLTEQIQERLQRQQQELEKKVESLEGNLDDKLTELQKHAKQQQEAIGTKVASLEDKIEQQATESNKRLDQLIELVSAMQ
jgi:hypothetical protein